VLADADARVLLLRTRLLMPPLPLELELMPMLTP
jgi:hypothetical protein